jgi:hypothetical protein
MNNLINLIKELDLCINLKSKLAKKEKEKLKKLLTELIEKLSE